MDDEGWLEEGPNTTKRSDEGRECRGKATESTEKDTEKTTTKSPRQIVLAYVREMSCRFLHAFCHGSVLTLLRFFLTVVLGLRCALKTVRSVRLCHWRFHWEQENCYGWALAPWMIHPSCVVSKWWGWSALWVWACPCAPSFQRT